MTWTILGCPHYQEIPGVLVMYHLFNWSWYICIKLSVLLDNLEENVILLNYVILQDK